MTRTPLLANLLRSFRAAQFCNRRRIPTREGIEMLRIRRRDLLKFAPAAALAMGRSQLPGAPAGSPPDIGIVGAGLAGLVCAHELQRRGARPTVYDASTGPGGRCLSLSGFFPGQVAERGGEFIDNLHKTLIGFAREFRLTLEDVTRQPGNVAYYFDGRHVPEAAVVEEFRALVPSMRSDLRALSGEPTADKHLPGDVSLDLTDLASYLRSRGAGSLAYQAIEQAYIAEYGLAAEQQSCLNFLLFIHADRRSKFQPFGVFSDERYHVVEGNQAIPNALSARLVNPVQYGFHLVRVRKTAAGRTELTFKNQHSALTRVHDAAVLAIPFTVLRKVKLDQNLGLPAWKLQAISDLGYGTNAKMMLGFSARPWAAHGSDGSSYSDLPSHQATWETNPSRATADRAILTDYSGAARGANLNPANVQMEAARFLADLETVYPGALAAATRNGRNWLAHLEHWPSNPLTLGSYTCYTPGQFTTIAGNEGKPVGNIFFAGEHANSFYEWQGFMEGAALSGLDAAASILGR
jgi:monoamine oxidase